MFDIEQIKKQLPVGFSAELEPYDGELVMNIYGPDFKVWASFDPKHPKCADVAIRFMRLKQKNINAQV